MFVANKCDLINRDELDYFKGYTRENDYMYYEISAFSTQGLKRLFTQVDQIKNIEF